MVCIKFRNLSHPLNVHISKIYTVRHSNTISYKGTVAKINEHVLGQVMPKIATRVENKNEQYYITYLTN